MTTLPATDSEAPSARIQQLGQAPGDPDRFYAIDTRGVMWAIENGEAVRPPFIDLRDLGIGFVEPSNEGGFRSFAFHPGFADPSSAGFGKLYTVHTATADSAQGGVRVFDVPLGGPATEVLFHDVVTEWTVADPTNPTGVLPESRRELFRIEEAFPNHNANQLAFDPNVQPGDAGYGALYLGVGDGGSQGDPSESAQNLGQIQGKVLRIDPLQQVNGEAYGIPAGNPFAGLPGALPEVWAYGFRNPQSLSFDGGGGGRLFVGEIGQFQIEEVDVVLPGGNYGWDGREGTFRSPAPADAGLLRLFPLPPGDEANGFQYPLAQYDHQEIAANNPFPGNSAAIAGGFVYRGTAIPELQGQYLFADLTTGRIFHVPIAGLEAALADGVLGAGEQVEAQELTVVVGGRATTLQDIAGAPGTGRVDLRFGQDASGELYVFSKTEGAIYRLELSGRGQSGTEGANALRGTAFGDVLDGLGGDDLVLGAAGFDRLLGGSGNDRLAGGAGGDEVTGGAGVDVARGGAGLDVLKGGSGDDRLKGGNGADLLRGGNGDDVLRGGGGADLFVVEAGGRLDRIVDFEDGVDRLGFEGFGGAFGSIAEVLAAARQTAGGVGIELSNGGGASTLARLAGFRLADLDASDFDHVIA